MAKAEPTIAMFSPTLSAPVYSRKGIRSDILHRPRSTGRIGLKSKSRLDVEIPTHSLLSSEDFSTSDTSSTSPSPYSPSSSSLEGKYPLKCSFEKHPAQPQSPKRSLPEAGFEPKPEESFHGPTLACDQPITSHDCSWSKSVFGENLGDTYCFTHDRIQKAAYTSAPQFVTAVCFSFH